VVGYPGIGDDAKAAGRLAWYGLSGAAGIATYAFIGVLLIGVVGFPLYALGAWLVGLLS